MADAGRGIELVEARRGDRRLNLWHIWDTQNTKPVVSLRGHIRLVELLHSHKCGNMTPQELTKACFKGTCTGTAKKVMGPSLAESILGLETPPFILRKHESVLLKQIDTICTIHPELLRSVFPTPVNSTKQAEEHKESDDESDNGPVNRDASLIAQVDRKIHGHAEAGDVRALWTQEWLLKKASDIVTRRQFASLYRNNGKQFGAFPIYFSVLCTDTFRCFVHKNLFGAFNPRQTFRCFRQTPLRCFAWTLFHGLVDKSSRGFVHELFRCFAYSRLLGSFPRYYFNFFVEVQFWCVVELLFQ